MNCHKAELSSEAAWRRPISSNASNARHSVIRDYDRSIARDGRDSLVRMSLIHVVYASSATPGFREQQIPDLLNEARSSNEERGITGMLLYIGGSFFQLLEGEDAVVDALYDKIRRDKRHMRVTQILREPILERDFTGWTMGYSTVTPMEAGKLLGENDFFNEASCVTRLDSGRAKTLLVALGKRRWQLERSGMFRALGRKA